MIIVGVPLTPQGQNSVHVWSDLQGLTQRLGYIVGHYHMQSMFFPAKRSDITSFDLI